MRTSKRLLFSALAVILLVGLVAGCAPYPHKGYYELDDAIAHAKTPEESKYYEGVRDRFEADAKKADAFYSHKKQCKAGNATARNGDQGMWFCSSRSILTDRDLDRRPWKDIEDMVRTYRKERHDCGCASRHDVLSQVQGVRY